MLHRLIAGPAAVLLLSLLTAGCSTEKRLSTTSDEARHAYTEGVALEERFYYTEARAAFGKAIAADSGFAMAWVRIAILDHRTDDEASARAAIQRATRLADQASPRERLFIAMWERRVNFDNARASALVDSFLTLYPDDPEALVFKGGGQELSRNLEGAIASYRAAVAAESDYAPAVMMLGYAYSTANEQDAAIEQMKRYIELVPDAADPRASYADLLLRVGRYDEALEQYRQSLKLKSDYWYSINQIGTIYSILGRLNEAERQYDTGYALLPRSGSVEAMHIAADASLDLYRGMYKEALEQYRTALGKDSSNLSGSSGMVFAYIRMGKFDDAAVLLASIRGELNRRDLTSSSAMFSVLLTRGMLLTRQGRYDEASAACDSALDLSTPITRPSVYRQIAEIALARKDYEEGLDACEQALSVNPNSPQGLLTLLKIYHASGDRGMTREIGRRLTTLWKDADPDFQDALEVKRILGETGPAGHV